MGPSTRGRGKRTATFTSGGKSRKRDGGQKRIKHGRSPSHSSSDEKRGVRVKSPSTKSADFISKPNRQRDQAGNWYWQLSEKRRVSISEFGGRKYIDVREYYRASTNNGESGEEEDNNDQMSSCYRPGKKGISLTLEQFVALTAAVSDIQAALREANIRLPRIIHGDGDGDGDNDSNVNTNANATTPDAGSDSSNI